jgi:hypothetical protein
LNNNRHFLNKRQEPAQMPALSQRGEMTVAYETRMKLAANGYDCVPLIGKRPVLPGWQKKFGATPADFTGWDLQLPRASNTGLNSRDTPGLDGDITNPEAAATFGDAVRDWFDGRGIVLTRIGQAPKRLIPFRTGTPFNKIVRVFRDPADKSPNPKPQRIEFLGDGQQYVAAGVHPDTGKPYQWHANRSPETTPRGELPEITEKEARELVDYLATMLMEKFGFEEIAVSETCHAAPNGHDADGSPFDPDACLQSMKPDAASVEEVQRRVALSRLQRGHYPQDIFDDLIEHTMTVADAAGLGWSRAVEIGKVSKRITDAFKYATKEWTRGIPPWLPGAFHIGWMRVEAEGQRPILVNREDGWYIRQAGRAGNGENGNGENGNGDAGKRPDDGPRRNGNGGKRADKRPHLKDVTLSWWKPIDPVTFPAREWLYGRHYQRQSVGLTTAPGGSGKTSADLLDAVAMATCRNLAGVQPEQRLRVWYHNAEDNLLEIQRRVLAICQRFNIDQSELDGWLIVTTCEQFDLKVANGFNDLKLDEAVLEAITAKIQELQIDVAILDPLINIHTTDEYNNVKMAQVLGALRSIAQAENCAIEVAQHTRKHPAGTTGDYTGADGRGAGSVRDAARSQRVLNIMSKEEAQKNCIAEHERRLYVRIDIDKANNSPPQAAAWLRIGNVSLPNGDEVGVVEPWVYPGAPGPDTPARAAAEAQADNLFMVLLHEFTLQGRDVSPTLKSPSYAPKLFAEEPAAIEAKVGSATLKAAMVRLFRADRIVATDAGTKHHKRSVLRVK